MSVTSGTRKRKITFEDSFSDIEIDDLELDEDDLKQLERIESPDKLANGNYKCNHPCKDRSKSGPYRYENTDAIDAGICVAKKAKYLENKRNRARKPNPRISPIRYHNKSQRGRKA
jgi:hypothetical protein